jgi:soluble lytic murein transglycosylase
MGLPQACIPPVLFPSRPIWILNAPGATDLPMARQPFLRVILIALLFALPLAALIFFCTYFWREYQREHLYEPQIAQAAARYKVDPLLVKAVIWQESRFNPKARGRAGEIGLMQIMEDAAGEWADAEKLDDFQHAHLFEPTRNIHAGAWYLAKVLKRYTNTDNPLPYALADYNAGRTHVLRWNKGAAATNSTEFLAQMDYPGTRKYALSVMQRYNYYRARERPAAQVPGSAGK